MINRTGTSKGTVDKLAEVGYNTRFSSSSVALISGTLGIGGTLACGGYKNGDDQVFVS